MKKSTLFFMMVLLTGVTYAQDITTQYAYWLRYQAQVVFSPSLQWNTEIDNRRFFSPDVALQFITHTRLHYRVKSWDLAGGLTYSVAYAQKPEEGYDEGVAEVRPVIEASHEIPVGKIWIQNRVRVDDRFIQSDPEQSVFKESTNIVRLRYRLQFRIPLKLDDTGQPKLSVRVGDEIMFNNWKNTFDQNRIYATFDFLLSKRFIFETGYLYIYQQRFGREEFFERHVLRLSLVQRILTR